MTRPLMRRAVAALIVAAACIATLATPAPAVAEDKRPCVSTTEYHQTKDIYKYRTTTARASEPTRRVLERRWEVRGLGVIDPALTDDRSTFWEYPVCGYSFEEAQVWAVTTGRSGPVGIISLWIEPGAMSNGHEYRAG